MSSTVPFVLSLGGNVGDVAAALARAVALLGAVPGVRVRRVSAVYRTPAWGRTDQPDFLNIVVLGQTTLSPEELLDSTQAIENELGRVRHEHWGPRVIDIDLVVVGDQVREDARLSLPHPFAHERAFVLVPWLDADPGAQLPGHGPVRALLGALDASGVVRVDGLTIAVP
ncbi:MAG: 2-amino-4-hydroxy-6-hydroxymethyldihydropteridine diphosphokinase [Propioniciclava sp.]|uniref:2-amino-4-hydroxy-6- hydroxymethyldihydropteridine diphosphokinase n=1 Tax=Propioniciclava sp. TaxID=2038686 RepID=UPI0039E6658E